MNENKGGSVLLWLITIALIIFTATRSVDLIQSTMPEDAKMIAYAALAGLDGGVLAWLFWTTRSAQGGVQRTIGAIMIVVDLAGIGAAVLGDTMLIASDGNKELVSMVAIWVVPVVIVSNVAATIIAHIFDPSQGLRDAQRAVAYELERQKAEHMRQNAPTIAAGVAQQAAVHEAAQMVARFISPQSNNGHGHQTLEVAGAVDVPKAKRRNR